MFLLLLRYDSFIVDNSYRWFLDSSAGSVDAFADNAPADDLLKFFLLSLTVCLNFLSSYSFQTLLSLSFWLGCQCRDLSSNPDIASCFTQTSLSD